MRALLLALCLVWATLHSGLRVAAASRDGGRPALASRVEQAVFTGSQPMRLLEARAPNPLPPTELGPLWFSLPAFGAALRLGPVALLARALETQRAMQGAGTARTARGPPALGV
ncbi:MAG TPA: hypothetical protein VMG12_08285 [Polyangiaceae bacterium]|nr:hypothetical protein [Polyangiaceae bacterium]